MMIMLGMTLLIKFTMFLFVSSGRRLTRCALVTGVQTCALPICRRSGYAPDGFCPDDGWPAPRRRSALPELDVAGMADHPLHAEAVGADAEFLGPFDLLQRHLDAAAVRQAGEHAVGFVGAVGFHRDVGVGADLEVAGPGDVGGHQQGRTDRQGDGGDAGQPRATPYHLPAAESPEGPTRKRAVYGK